MNTPSPPSDGSIDPTTPNNGCRPTRWAVRVYRTRHAQAFGAERQRNNEPRLLTTTHWHCRNCAVAFGAAGTTPRNEAVGTAPIATSSFTCAPLSPCGPKRTAAPSGDATPFRLHDSPPTAQARNQQQRWSNSYPHCTGPSRGVAAGMSEVIRAECSSSHTTQTARSGRGATKAGAPTASSFTSRTRVGTSDNMAVMRAARDSKQRHGHCE